MTDAQPDPNARVAAARLAELELRLTHPLSPEQRTQVEQRIGRTLLLAVRMRHLPLDNADEPAGDFVPYRADR